MREPGPRGGDRSVTTWPRGLGRSAGESLALLILTVDVARGGPITQWEERRHRPPRRFPPASAQLSRLGTPATLRAGLLASLVLSHRGDPQRVAAPLRVLAGVALRSVACAWVARRRPPEAWWLEEPEGYSFPSRHTANALLLTRLACTHTPRHCGDTAFWTVAVLVGGSRLRLGVHWPTDVVGAALASDLWWSITALDPRA